MSERQESDSPELADDSPSAASGGTSAASPRPTSGVAGYVVVAIALAAWAVFATKTSAGDATLQWIYDLEAWIKGALSLLCGVILLLGHGEPKRRASTGLKLVALISLLAHFNFGGFHRNYAVFVHGWEHFHYELGAKYFPELGYDGLYFAAVDMAERMTDEIAPPRRFRDLRTNGFISLEDAREPMKEIRERFSQERWRQFALDLKPLLGAMRSNKLLLDHGYNPSPAWTFVAQRFLNWHTFSLTHIKLLCLIDPILLGLMFLILFRTYGSRVGCLSVIVFALGHPWRFDWVGGAFLRFDWLAALVIGICMMKRERWRTAGALLGYAAMVRVFPILFLFGPIVVAARCLLRRESTRWALRLAQGVTIAALLGLAAGSMTGRGFGAWSEFQDNIRAHRKTYLTNNVGFQAPLLYGAQFLVTGDFRLTGSWTDAIAAREQARLPLIIVMSGLMMALLSVSVWRRPPDEATMFGLGAVFILVMPTCYYWSMLLLLPLVAGQLATAMLLIMNAGFFSLEGLTSSLGYRYGAISWGLTALLVALTLPAAWRLIRRRAIPSTTAVVPALTAVSPSRVRRARLVLAFGSLLVALGIAEVAVRAVGWAPEVKPIWLSHDDNVYRRSENPILGFELKPSYLNDNPNPSFSYPSTNAFGQRDIERTLAKQEGTTRIILLGDSVVEGHGIMDVEATISRQLEKLSPDGSVEVLNFGVSGYCTLSEIELLETKGLQFDPDIVILVFTQNDFRNFNPIAFDLEASVERPEWVKVLFVESHLFRLVSLRFSLFGFGQEPDPIESNRQAIGDNNVTDGLERFAKLAQSHDFKPLVVIWPERDDDRIVDDPFMPDGKELIVESLARMNGLRISRLSGFLKEYLRVTPDSTVRDLYITGDPLHPSPLGCSVVARSLTAILSDLDRYAPLKPSDDDSAAIAAAAKIGTEEQPTTARLHNNRGRKLLDARQFDKAEVEFKAALEKDPNVPEVYFNLGVVYDGLKRPEDARAAYRECLIRDPDNQRAHHNLGLIAMAEGALDSARVHFESAIVIDQHYALAYHGLGIVLARSGDAEAAREQFQKAAELDPAWFSPELNIGNTYIECDQPGDALPHYQLAHDLSPFHFLTNYHLAVVKDRLGETEEAIVHCRDALLVQPAHPAALAMMERLKLKE